MHESATATSPAGGLIQSYKADSQPDDVRRDGSWPDGELDGADRSASAASARWGVAAGVSKTHPSGVATMRPIGHSVGRTFLHIYDL